MSTCDDLHRPGRAGFSTALRHETAGAVLVSAWRRFLAGAAARRERARRDWLRYSNEREIAKLSPEIRKDIGWPPVDGPQNRR